MLAHVVPHLVFGPFGERVELHDRAVVVVDLDLADVAACRPLVAAQAGDPRVEAAEVPLQREHLAHLAAEQPILDRPVEEVRPVLPNHRAHRACVGREQIEIELRIALPHPLDELVRLLRQTPGVDAEQLDLRVDLVRHVQEHRAVGLEGGRDGDPRRELPDGPLEHDLRLLSFELDGQLARFQVVKQLD